MFVSKQKIGILPGDTYGVLLLNVADSFLWPEMSVNSPFCGVTICGIYVASSIVNRPYI